MHGWLPVRKTFAVQVVPSQPAALSDRSGPFPSATFFWTTFDGESITEIPWVPFACTLLFVIAGPLLAMLIFFRVGLVAYVALFFSDVLLRVPMTLDPKAWYFGYSLVVLIILAALATYGFLVSLGGRPAFGASAA